MGVIVREFELYERICESEDFYEDLSEMANLHSNVHKIPDVVIWVGKENKQHGLRVKVSNVKNRFDPSNCFVIQMPSLDYNPKKVASWIDKTTLEKIFDWIKENQDTLYKYETGIIDDTVQFIRLVSGNKIP